MSKNKTSAVIADPFFQFAPLKRTEEMEELIVEIVEPVSVEYVSPEEAENMDSDGAVEISIVNDSSEE